MMDSAKVEEANDPESYAAQLTMQQTIVLMTSVMSGENKTLLVTMLNDSTKIFEQLKKKIASQPQAQDFLIGIQATFLSIIGTQYQEIGEYTAALNSYHQALLLYEQLEQTQAKSMPASSTFSELMKSQLYQTALVGKATPLKDMGTTLVRLDKKPEAIAAFQKALKLFQDLKNKQSQGTVLVELGKVQRSSKQYQAAIDSFNQALTINREFGAIVNEANTRLEIARTERDRNNLIAAQAQIETSIQLIETEPPSLSQSSSLSEQKQFTAYIELASYFSTRQYFYDFYIDIIWSNLKNLSQSSKIVKYCNFFSSIPNGFYAN
ncbi:TPR repeat-containing protein [Leptolyngbya sp. NIES-3755]|nr:TPR repeat-containing protein [Leptolyngbya sp. NIES-3755]